jgi:purine-cytosine permease-like protein
VMAIILGCWALTFPRRRHATKSAPLPVQVVIFCAAMDLVALAANAIGVPVGRLPGVYAASITAILIGAAMLFLFAFVHWYEALLSHEKPKA